MIGQEAARVRVIHLISTLGVYGAERWILTHVQSLGGSSIDSHVLTFGSKDGAGDFHRLLAENGVPATHLAIAGKINFGLLAEIRRCIVRESAEIVHTHGFKADVLGYMATRGLGCRVVSTVHGWCGSEGLRIRVYEALSKHALRRFDRVYALSPSLYGALIQDGFDADRVEMILNAIAVDAFDAIAASRRTDARTEGLRVLFAGRLCVPKGVYELLAGFAMASLAKGSTLTLAGVGPEREGLERRCVELGIEGRVHFAGHVERMGEAYANADVIVLPSYSEGVPRVIMEAYASSLPVIGSDIPGIQELVVDGVTGVLIPVADADAVSRALERIDADRDEADRFGVCGRKLVEERFSASRQANEYQVDYRRLVQTIRCGPPNTEAEGSAGSTG
jgi:glycosyltransferase involved in cell wall biosynthesis